MSRLINRFTSRRNPPVLDRVQPDPRAGFEPTLTAGPPDDVLQEGVLRRHQPPLPAGHPAAVPLLQSGSGFGSGSASGSDRRRNASSLRARAAPSALNRGGAQQLGSWQQRCGACASGSSSGQLKGRVELVKFFKRVQFASTSLKRFCWREKSEIHKHM